MGREARINPRSREGGTSQRDALIARLARFVDFFERREDYEAYLLGRDVTADERAMLDSLLPERLRVVTQ